MYTLLTKLVIVAFYFFFKSLITVINLPSYQDIALWVRNVLFV
jgi:hypothetical protein